MPAGTWNQGLHDHRAQSGGHLHANLLLLIFRVHVDQTVHGRTGVLRVQGGEHQVAGFHGGQRGGNGFEVSKLAHFDNVGIFTKRAFKRFRETFGVGSHFTLAHHATLVLMHEFDRVFNGDDMVGAFGIRSVDNRGERGGFAGAGRTAYEHESTRQ